MRFFNELLVPALMVGVLGVGSNALMQEQEDEQIEIADRDGRRVNAKVLRWKDGEQQDEVRVQVADGKIIIVDEDGERREIDVTGAQNIIVNKSVRSIMRDGEEEKQVTGKAIIVGPDGKKQVIDLGGNFGELLDLGGMKLEVMPFLDGDGDGFRLPGKFLFGKNLAGKFVIGVNCNPVSDQLRAHLDIKEGAGLVVVSEPAEDSPAANGGIEMHDILMYADQIQLAKIKDLVDAVQTAGKEDRELSLTLVRKGNELSIDLKPTERKANLGNNLGQKTLFMPGNGKFDFQVEEFGPGVIFGNEDDLPEDILEKMEAIDERIKSRMEELTRLQEQFRESFSNLNNEDDD